MARRLRIHVPDDWSHVMSRGNGGEAIFRTDEDRQRFLGLVSEVPARFGTEVQVRGGVSPTRPWWCADGQYVGLSPVESPVEGADGWKVHQTLGAGGGAEEGSAWCGCPGSGRGPRTPPPPFLLEWGDRPAPPMQRGEAPKASPLELVEMIVAPLLVIFMLLKREELRSSWL